MKQIRQMLDERYSADAEVRWEIHYTPKHGSWLNMAKIELSILKGQCLDWRIVEMEAMRVDVLAWEKHRNNNTKKIRWHFTAEDARIKLTKGTSNIKVYIN